MQYYVVLDGNTLKFQKTKPLCGDYVQSDEEKEMVMPDPFFPWLKYQTQTERVQFLDKISPVSTQCWFFGFRNLKSFDKLNLDLSRTKTMTGMFEECDSLQTLDLSGLDVSNVKSLSEMLKECNKLTEVNLTGWDTSKVQNFGSMFILCHKLKKLDLSSFSMKSAENISFCFYGCSALESLNLPAFPDNGNLVNAYYAFYGCKSLQYLDLSGFNPRFNKGTNITKKCYSLQNIRISQDALPYLGPALKI